MAWRAWWTVLVVAAFLDEDLTSNCTQFAQPRFDNGTYVFLLQRPCVRCLQALEGAYDVSVCQDRALWGLPVSHQ